MTPDYSLRTKGGIPQLIVYITQAFMPSLLINKSEEFITLIKAFLKSNETLTLTVL
jgi:hypothetical protein